MATALTKVSAPSRLHMGLLDLAHATPRTYGGFGLMISQPEVVVVGTAASTATTIGGDLTPRERHDLTVMVDALCSSRNTSGCEIEVIEQPAAHIGLGRGTALRLAALTCAAASHGVVLGRREIQRLSGRGGTSGVGINGFFEGGLIVDAGHGGRLEFAPSRATRPESVPPVISRLELDPDWFITLAFPATQGGVSGSEEHDFFRARTPVPTTDVLTQIALLYHGILPCLLEHDLAAAGRIYSEFTRLGFKFLEIASADGVRPLIDAISEVAPFVGMSSLGPCVFAISEESILEAARSRLPSAYTVIETHANNHGHVVGHA